MSTKYPLLWCACCLAFGIILYHVLPFSMTGRAAAILLACGFFALAAMVRGKKGILPSVFLCILLMAGMGRMFLSEESFSRESSWCVGSEGVWTGVVWESPSVQKEGKPYARYFVELESIEYPDGEEKKLSGTAFVYETETSRLYRTGDRISFNGKMSALRIYDNPGKIDLEGRYRSRRLLGRIYPKEAESLHYLGVSGDFRAQRWADEIRENVETAFAPYMDEVRLHVLMTLLFGGNYNEIPEHIMSSYSTTGIVHILSVSGSHVALLFGFLYFLGKWIRLPRRAVISGAILLVLFYSFLAGLVPPVIRAAMMGILSVGGVFMEREKSSLNLLGAAVSGMLLWDPFYLYDVSFQLSVGASAGILLFYQPLLRFIRKGKGIPLWIAEGIALSTAAQVLTVPPVLYDFHRFPLYFIPANLFVTPFLEWVIIAGLLAAVLSMACMPLAGGILYISDYLLWFSLRLNLWLSAFPRAALQTGSMTAVQTFLYYLTVGILYFKKEISACRKWRLSLLSLWIGSLGLSLYLYISSPSVILYAPDLGPDQGAVLVTEEHTILYYRGGSIPSHTSAWEWKSIIGYEGVEEGDVLLLNLEEVKEPMALTMAVPVKEIWVTGGSAEIKAPLLIHGFQGKIRNIQSSSLQLGSLSFLTNGSSWLIREGERGVYLSGRKGLNVPSFPEHTLWVAGNWAGRGIPEEEMDRVKAEEVIYGGSCLPSSFEDMELFTAKEHHGANLYTEGMQTAVFKNQWKLEGKKLWQ